MVVLDGISKNMEFLVQTGKYVSISIAEPTIIVYCFAKFISITMTFRGDNKIYRNSFTSGKNSVKSAYLSSIKVKKS